MEDKNKQTRQGKDYVVLTQDPLYKKVKNLLLESGAVDKGEFHILLSETVENWVRLQKLVRRIYTQLDENFTDLYNVTDKGLYKKNPLLSEAKALASEARNHTETIIKMTNLNKKDSDVDLKKVINDLVG